METGSPHNLPHINVDSYMEGITVAEIKRRRTEELLSDGIHMIPSPQDSQLNEYMAGSELQIRRVL